MSKVRSDRVKEVTLTQGTIDVVLVGTGTGFVPLRVYATTEIHLIIQLPIPEPTNGKPELEHTMLKIIR